MKGNVCVRLVALMALGLSSSVMIQGCGGGDDDGAPTGDVVDQVVPVGVTPRAFTHTSGTLDIAVAIQNAIGTSITGLAPSDISLRNVTLTAREAISSTSMQPAGIASSPIQVTANVTMVADTPASSGGAITAVLDLDDTGSMTSSDSGAVGRKAGVNAFTKYAMDGNDSVATVRFSTHVTPSAGLDHTSIMQNFTTDETALTNSLSQLENNGTTPLWGSALDGLKLLASRIGTGGVLVLLTDGLHNSGSETPSNVIVRANAQNTQVFCVGLGRQLQYDKLAKVASETHGSFAEANDANELAAAFRGVGAAASSGFTTASASLSFPSVPAGTYLVQGDLDVTSGGATKTTPISATLEIE